MTKEKYRKEIMSEADSVSSERNSQKWNEGVEDVTAKSEKTPLPGNQNYEYIPCIERVISDFNIQEAIFKVKKNKGAPGIDNITTEEIEEVMCERWPEMKKAILEGRYHPDPVKRAEIEKPDGSGIRKLGIPTVPDRVIQQAILQEIMLAFEPTFSESSYGFRPGRSAHQAVTKAQRYIQEGYDWVVDIDLEKFFDTVNHDMLMARVARKVKDKKILLLIRRYLQSGIMKEGLISFPDEGTPQGGPLSPLLSNILLDDFDKELEKRGHRFCRYADDCNIYVKSEKAGKRVMETATRYLTKKLKLKVNLGKSAVDKPCNRKFLGFCFGQGLITKKPNQIKVHSSRIKRFKDGVRKIIKQGKGKNIPRIIQDELIPKTRGWINYFGLAQETSIFTSLDSWIRRKIRCALWEQWKTSKKRIKEMLKRGAKKEELKKIVSSGKGPWRISRTECMHRTIGNRVLEKMGLIPMMKMIRT
jgi:RNA-directed DNA polymerase